VGGSRDNSFTGAAWVWFRSGGVWNQQGDKLVGPGAAANTEFGSSVALSADGTTALVGGPGDNSGIGAAWVFVQPTTLRVSPMTNLATAGNPGGPFTPSSFQYQLSTSVGTVNYSISGVPDWLTSSSISGTASSSAATVTFTVNANANSLAVGTFGPTAITFTNSDTGQGTQTRTATLTVNPPALLVVPTTNILASGIHGGPFSPSSFQYELSASYGGVNYSIVTPSWLTASATSGTVTTKPKTITFRPNSSADKLLPSTYVNSVTFNNTTNSQGSTTRLATLTVNPKQFQITVGASPRADGMVSGGGTFAEGTSQTVTATPNAGHTFVHWTENGKVVSTLESYTFTLPR
jgi:hypothetical protein